MRLHLPGSHHGGGSSWCCVSRRVSSTSPLPHLPPLPYQPAGDANSSQDLEFIVANKVTRIVNAAGREVPNSWERTGIRYLRYPWPQSGNCIVFDDSNSVLDEVFTFIEQGVMSGEGVLLHSVHGTSRACFIAAMYFMLKYRWTLPKTMSFISSKRGDVNPKPGFLRQLHALNNSLQRVTKAQLGSGADHDRRFDAWDPSVIPTQAAPVESNDDESVIAHTYLNGQRQQGPAGAADGRTGRPSGRRLRWLDEGAAVAQGGGQRVAGRRGALIRPASATYSDTAAACFFDSDLVVPDARRSRPASAPSQSASTVSVLRGGTQWQAQQPAKPVPTPSPATAQHSLSASPVPSTQHLEKSQPQAGQAAARGGIRFRPGTPAAGKGTRTAQGGGKRSRGRPPIVSSLPSLGSTAPAPSGTGKAASPSSPFVTPVSTPTGSSNTVTFDPFSTAVQAQAEPVPLRARVMPRPRSGSGIAVSRARKAAPAADSLPSALSGSVTQTQQAALGRSASFGARSDLNTTAPAALRALFHSTGKTSSDTRKRRDRPATLGAPHRPGGGVQRHIPGRTEWGRNAAALVAAYGGGMSRPASAAATLRSGGGSVTGGGAPLAASMDRRGHKMPAISKRPAQPGSGRGPGRSRSASRRRGNPIVRDTGPLAWGR